MEQTNEIVANSFVKLPVEFHKVKSPMWTAKHAQQWLVNLEKYALQTIGDSSITDIEPMDIMKIMREMKELGIHETHDRLLQTVSSLFKYAIATGRAKLNPAQIRIALAERQKVENFACISPVELPVFLREVTAYQNINKVSTIAKFAFRLLMLTATRISKVRFSKWSDFDLIARSWIIPAEQTGRKGRVTSARITRCRYAPKPSKYYINYIQLQGKMYFISESKYHWAIN